MYTRGPVSHQYGQHPANYSAPPFHVIHHEHQYPVPTDRARLYGTGGLMGGAVPFHGTLAAGYRVGSTGYGYLGMDPSDPGSWIVRPFVPTAGMISYLNFGAGV